MGIGKSHGLDDSALVMAALHRAKLQVCAGFKATERRLVFAHGNQMSTSPTLFTVLPSGQMEGSLEGKPLKPTREKGLITYPYVQQHIDNPDKAKELFDTNCVWEDGKGKFPVVQLWTVNINKYFRDAFEITEENPDTKHFHLEAIDNLMKTLEALFGEEATKEKVKYCTKTTLNIDRTFLGTPAQFGTFFGIEGVKEALNIISGDQNTIEVETLDKSGNKGQQMFRFDNGDDTLHVLYKRKGFTSFWCLKSKEQFEHDCEFQGKIDP